jgi:hypothetical protein
MGVPRPKGHGDVLRGAGRELLKPVEDRGGDDAQNLILGIGQQQKPLSAQNPAIRRVTVSSRRCPLGSTR